MPLESDHTGGHEDPPLLVKWGTRRGLSYPWASGPTPTVKWGGAAMVGFVCAAASAHPCGQVGGSRKGLPLE